MAEKDVARRFKMSMSGMNPMAGAGAMAAAALMSGMSGKNGMSQEVQQQMLHQVAASQGISAEQLKSMDQDQVQKPGIHRL